MIKIEIRNNLIYPALLLLFIFLCRVDEILIKNFYKYKINLFFSLFIFIPQFFAGLIPIVYDFFKNKKKDKKEDNIKSNFISGKKRELKLSDDYKKIIFLLLVDSYFNFLGIITGKHSFKTSIKKGVMDDFVEKRVRGAQIVFASLLCILILKEKNYRHQIFSLIVISFFLLAIILMDLLWLQTDLRIICIFIFCFFIRAYLDVIEKYMFKYNNANPFKILLWEGIFGNIFYGIYYLFNSDDIKNEVKEAFSKKDNKNYIVIFLLIIYLFFSGFRSIYRVHTVLYFSPMARALFELVLDPFLIIYKFLTYNNDPDNWFNNHNLYFSIFIPLEFIMAFLALIYNEFIVIYCCGCEKNTFFGIESRAEKDVPNEINFGLIDNLEVSGDITI